MPDITVERDPNPSTINWPELLAFILQAFAYMEGRVHPPSSIYRLTADGLREKAQTETLLLARESHRIVGCMFCREEGAYLYVGKVAVAPAEQGRGIGRTLFDVAFKMAKASGMMGLELETRAELTETHKMFEKLGFEKVAESAHEGYERATSITMRAILD